MGIPKGGTGACAGCDHEHIRLWGPSNCKYLKLAMEKCSSLNIDLAELKLHIDEELIQQDIEDSLKSANAGSGEIKHEPLQTVDEKTVKGLMDVFHQQRTQIDRLISQFQTNMTYVYF